MERKHREAIRVNFMSLVAQTDLDLMVGALYEKRVFSDAMIEDYRDTNKSILQRKRQLYLDLPRRGPNAFQHLLDALSENGYWDLVRSLDPDSTLHTAATRALPKQTGESSYLSLSAQRQRYAPNDPDINKNPSSQSPPAPASSRPPRPRHETGNGYAGTPTPMPTPMPARALSPAPAFEVRKARTWATPGPGQRLYRTRGRRRGVLVLFSYVTFNGTDDARRGGLVDHQNLKYLFTELGFSVISYNNLTYQETLDALQALQTPSQLLWERPECVFVVFASHGYPAGASSSDAELRCHDGRLLSLHRIVRYFSNATFPRLIGIPKVFIFQNCRGDMDKGSASRNHAPALLSPTRRVHRAQPPPRRGALGGTRARAVDGHTFTDEGEEEGGGGEDTHERDYSDVLIAHSTVPGYVSNRDSEKGSWYIQSLCRVFAERAHDCHVEGLFKLVDEYMAKVYRTQTSSTENWGFNPLLYLHPGLHEDS